MNVTAVVVAGGRPGGLDTLTPVGGVPMVVHAVRCLLATGLVDRVAVLDTAARTDAVAHACSGLPVSACDGLRSALRRAHVGQRCGDATGVFTEVVLLHDAARPLAPPELAVAVVEAVRSGQGAAVPVLPLADTVKQVAGDGIVRVTADRSALRVVQTPQAVRRDLLDTGLAVGPLTAAVTHATLGRAVHTVPGHPRASAVRSAWDLELAELLVGLS